jgi:hypothetical protein
MKDIKPSNKPVRDTKKFTPKFNYADRLVLSQELKDKIKREGMVFRFLNKSELQQNQGYHRSHWTAYRVQGEDIAKFGALPDGTFVRGDLVLGVRTFEMNNSHKEYLAERNAAYAGFNKKKAQEMRDDIRRKGLQDSIAVDDKDDDEKSDDQD